MLIEFSRKFVSEDNYDYVEEDVDKVSSDISLYQCEMPAEKIKRLKAKQDSLSRLKDLPLGVKSLYPTINTRWEILVNKVNT